MTAVGGDGDSFSLTGGGAGIGTGGVTGNIWAPFPNEICVSISGGTVDAAGTADGAGIGGGANVNGGVIEITARQPEAVEGFCFDGWYVDEGCTEKFADGTVLDEDTVLYGRWLPKLTPVLPQAAAYRVEHYLEQPDGSYALEETEFPLYGAVGQTVTAVPKQWAGRHVNEARSVLAGTVALPVAENGTVQVLCPARLLRPRRRRCGQRRAVAGNAITGNAIAGNAIVGRAGVGHAVHGRRGEHGTAVCGRPCGRGRAGRGSTARMTRLKRV